jgi:hypothetical protein
VRQYADAAPRVDGGGRATVPPMQAFRTESPLRVLVVAHNLSASVRHIGPVVQELLDRGHEVHLALEPPERKHADDPWLLRASTHAGFTWGIVETWRRDPWFLVARWLRRTDDYIRYLLIGRERIPYFVERAAGRAPLTGRLIAGLPVISSRTGLKLLSCVLSAFDGAVPTSRPTVDFIRQLEVDVIVLVPILMPGSTDSAYLRAASAAGIPGVLCVPSWDNLSSKQLLRVIPDRLAVWNETQRQEARELHGIPNDRIVVTGAQTFDHWFTWRPSARETFCERVGLDPSRPYVLYVGGALFPGALTEAEFGRRWIERLRATNDDVLRHAGILVRPHPKRTVQWTATRFDDIEGVAVWPRKGHAPGSAEADADYYDSIYHSVGVVGVNTSAMIEAAIIGRPVFTVLVPEFHSSQRGTFHFQYVLERDGGFVRVAETLDEHLEHLSALVRGESEAQLAAGRRFVETFVRPHGIDTPATTAFADAIEEVVRLGPAVPIRKPGWSSALRVLLLPGLARVQVRRIKQKLFLEVRRIAGRLPSTAGE